MASSSAFCRWLGRIAVVVIGLWGGALPVAGQTADPDDPPTYTVALRNVPLERALEQFIQRTGVDIAYANAIVRRRSVYCRARDATAEALLRCILAGTGIDYLRTSSGTYLLVDAFRAPDALGHLAGTVIDAATGEPLPRANVLLADASAGTATDPAGRFNLASVLAGAHRLVVTYVGYATYVDSVWVPPDGRRTVRVALEPEPLAAEPLIVDGLQRRLPSAALGQNGLAAGDLIRLTGAGTGDVLRSASRQVGVSLNRPRAELHVQGGDGGEHVTLLDDVTMREPVSLGGLLAAFSPHALSRITVHKTGFPAPYGSYTAGVVEVEHDLARFGTRHVDVSVDPVSLNARADAGWNRNASGMGRAMLAARTSVWDAYRAPSLDHMLASWTHFDPTLTAWWIDPSATRVQPLRHHPASHVRFADLHGALQQELSPFHRLYVSGYHGRNRLGANVASLLTGGDGSRLLATHGRTGWDNTMLQLRHEWLAGARTTGAVQVYGSRHDSHFVFGLRDSLVQTPFSVEPGTLALPDDPHAVDHSTEGNALDEWGGRVRVDVSLSPRYSLNASIEPHYLRGRVHVRNRFLGAIKHDVDVWQMGSHVEGEVSLGLGTTVTAGARLTYLPARRTLYAEPRLALRHDRSTTPLGDLALRLAGGIYRQYVVQSEVSNGGPTAVVPAIQFWLPLDGSIAPPRAYHVAADALIMPSDAWTLRLETYYKRHPRTLQIDYAGLVHNEPLDDARAAHTTVFERQADFMAAGEGMAFGSALRVQYDDARVSADATAEVGRARRRYPGRFNGRRVPASWEQPLRLASNLDVRLAEGVHALGSWQGVWGRPWALRRAYYDYVALTDAAETLTAFDLDRPGNQVLAPFSRFDVGLRAETTIRGVTVEAQTSIVNVFDRANPFDWSLAASAGAPERIARTLPGRHLFVLIGLRY